jgi:hypothetical protein
MHPMHIKQLADQTSVRPSAMPTEEGSDPLALTEEGLSVSYEDVVNDKADFIFDLTKVSDGVTAEAWKAYLANSVKQEEIIHKEKCGYLK